MADLPDLDTSEVSFIAYWNAIDQGGVSNIDPSEATSATNSYTLYDNGFEGEIDVHSYRSGKCRVKEDGWIIVWIDRTETFDQYRNVQAGDDYPAGPWDFLGDITATSDPMDVGAQNSLERTVNNLRTELSNSGNMAYSSSDVGLYNYQHTGATTVTALSANETSPGNDDEVLTTAPSLQYTDDTDIKWATCLGLAYTPVASSTKDSRIAWEGTELAHQGQYPESDGGDGEGREYGALDLVAGAYLDSANTTYSGDITVSSYYSGYARGTVTVTSLWA